jgi:hypothetical protein
MTRADFIQRAVLQSLPKCEYPATAACLAADALEKSGVAPWDNNTSPPGTVGVGVMTDARVGVVTDASKDDLHVINALLNVEKAARKLREPVGYESGASSHELDEALARLDSLRSSTAAPSIPKEGAIIKWGNTDQVVRKCKGTSRCFACERLGYHLEPIERCARCFGTGLVTAGGVSVDCPKCSGPTGPSPTRDE